uniref:Uncharacterized protein n=1 Tax=Lepeophtheirus salmonis TaxID=72036 RepID=A0A0K2UM98_LEPSM
MYCFMPDLSIIFDYYLQSHS